MARRYVPTREAAEYLGISVDALHRLTSNREIRFYRFNGRQLRFKVDDLDDFMWARRVEVEAS